MRLPRTARAHPLPPGPPMELSMAPMPSQRLRTASLFPLCLPAIGCHASWHHHSGASDVPSGHGYRLAVLLIFVSLLCFDGAPSVCVALQATWVGERGVLRCCRLFAGPISLFYQRVALIGMHAEGPRTAGMTISFRFAFE